MQECKQKSKINIFTTIFYRFRFNRKILGSIKKEVKKTVKNNISFEENIYQLFKVNWLYIFSKIINKDLCVYTNKETVI